MFYAHFVLSKKGPLARIWLAAHWDKKLTKAHVFETNIEGSVEAIIQPKAKLALRTSGHLLLGVVRIYSRKAKYLLADCNEAFVKIKMAFRPGVVDLPEENREAALSAITLPEAFHEFDTTMADLSDLDVQAHFTGNQSRPEEITMREDLGNITLVGDDGFGDMGFEGDLMDDDRLDDGLYMKSGDPLTLEGATEPDQDSRHPMDIDFNDQQHREDAFALPMDDDYEGPAGADDDDDDNEDSDRDDFGGDGDVDREDIFGEKFIGDGGGLFEDPMAEPAASSGDPVLLGQPSIDPFMQPVATPGPDAVTMRPNFTTLGFDTLAASFQSPPASVQAGDNLTLIQNEAEAFALKPIDITTIGTERKVRKKRKLVIDEQKAIASETMKLQLSDTSDIVTTLDLAPPTKKLMHWKETGGVEKLFAFPGHGLVSKKLSRLFSVNLITKSAAESQELPRVELEPEQPRAEEFEAQDHLSAAGDMPELAPATQDAYRPPTTEAPSIVDESSVFVDRMSDVSAVTDVKQPASDMTSRDAVAQSTPMSPTPSLPTLLPPRGGNSDDDDDDNYGGFYNDDASTDAEEEEQQQQQPVGEEEEEEEDVTLEPLEGEAEEEAEERRWNKRSQQMLQSLTRVLVRRDTIGFQDLIASGTRKHAASKFYTLLVLKKSQAINIEQAEPYGAIQISKGAAFTAIC